MNRNMGIPETLSGIKVKDIPNLAERADKEANPLYPVPKLMDAEELQQFYYKVMSKEEFDEQSGNSPAGRETA